MSVKIYVITGKEVAFANPIKPRVRAIFAPLLNTGVAKYGSCIQEVFTYREALFSGSGDVCMCLTSPRWPTCKPRLDSPLYMYLYLSL